MHSVAESLHCSPEIVTILLIDYTVFVYNTKEKFFLRNPVINHKGKEYEKYIYM